MSRYLIFLIAVLASRGFAQVVSYEGTAFPEEEQWEHETFCSPDRAPGDGWLVQHVEVGCGGPPGGDKDRYERSLSDFADEAAFFFEWRVQTDGKRSEIGGVSPTSFTTGDLFGISYHFTIARDQVRFIRDNFLPLVYAEIAPGVPHTYRLELHGPESYTWYIDREIVDSGVPEGPYRTPSAVLSWRAKAWYLDSTTRWDYSRFGVIPEDGSGDYDSDEAVDLDDFYFFRECVSNGGPDADAGPGCRFADFDADVDLRDVAVLQNSFTGGG